jgi:hypothetical protein
VADVQCLLNMTSLPEKPALMFMKLYMALIRERTIPIERPRLVGDVSVNFCGYRVMRGRHDKSLRQYSLFSRPTFQTSNIVFFSFYFAYILEYSDCRITY